MCTFIINVHTCLPLALQYDFKPVFSTLMLKRLVHTSVLEGAPPAPDACGRSLQPNLRASFSHARGPLDLILRQIG